MRRYVINSPHREVAAAFLRFRFAVVVLWLGLAAFGVFAYIRYAPFFSTPLGLSLSSYGLVDMFFLACLVGIVLSWAEGAGVTVLAYLFMGRFMRSGDVRRVDAWILRFKARRNGRGVEVPFTAADACAYQDATDTFHQKYELTHGLVRKIM